MLTAEQPYEVRRIAGIIQQCLQWRSGCWSSERVWFVQEHRRKLKHSKNFNSKSDVSLSFVKYLVVFYCSPVLSVFHSFLLLTCQFLALWLYICYFNLFCLESKYPCLLGHCMRYCLWTEGSEPPNGTWTLTLLSLDIFWFLPAFSLLHKCNFFVSFFSLKLHLTKWKKYKHPERALWNGLWSQTGMGSGFLSAPFCLVWCWASYLCP